MKDLIIGLGNPIMGDDAVGCKAAEIIHASLTQMGNDTVEVDQFYRGGIALMERLIGYDRVLIIDSVTGTGKQPGTVRLLPIDELPSLNSNSPHDTNLKNALALGRIAGEHLPEQTDILAVEIESKFEFSEKLSSPINACLPGIVQIAMEWIMKEENAQN